MTELLLPKHVASARRTQMETSAAQSISRSTVHRIDSDDFVTRREIEGQLKKLEDYITLRRQEEPEYHLPRPMGWKLMVLMMTIPDESAGGVIIIDETKEARAVASPQGIVLDVGCAAYSDPARFSVHGELTPWCAVGDRITMIKYDASLFQIANGQRLGFLNDTQPISCIDRGWKVPS